MHFENHVFFSKSGHGTMEQGSHFLSDRSFKVFTTRNFGGFDQRIEHKFLAKMTVFYFYDAIVSFYFFLEKAGFFDIC